MAVRIIMNVSSYGGAIRKEAKEVLETNSKIRMLLKDMAETMYNSNGIGLAANQVGVLKRIVVIDIGEGLIRLVNPVIAESCGEQIGQEGCLSIPDVWGVVKRPEKVVVSALNEKGEKIEIKGKGLLARVLCHEIDHLDGVLFIDRAEPDTLIKSKKGTRL